MNERDDLLRAMTWALLAMLLATISMILSVVAIVQGLGS